jgi:hypothetical protein
MPNTRRWSQKVTETSDALDIKGGTFALNDPADIARELKRDAEQSHRRKSSPYHSAMSMLTFFINRAGSGLSATRKKKLEQAKTELRKQFGIEETNHTTRKSAAKSEAVTKKAARRTAASGKANATKKATPRKATAKKATPRKATPRKAGAGKKAIARKTDATRKRR